MNNCSKCGCDPDSFTLSPDGVIVCSTCQRAYYQDEWDFLLSIVRKYESATKEKLYLTATPANERAIYNNRVEMCQRCLTLINGLQAALLPLGKRMWEVGNG